MDLGEEACEDLDLHTDDEQLSLLGKGDRRRTVLLDDPQLVAMLRRYLKHTGYRHGPLFRAQKNGRGGPLSYQSAQRNWAMYCATAGISTTLHQLRHTHATELVNDGVSLATIRKRLGHKNLQTTLRYAEQTDATADTELPPLAPPQDHAADPRSQDTSIADNKRSRIAANYRSRSHASVSRPGVRWRGGWAVPPRAGVQATDHVPPASGQGSSASRTTCGSWSES